jgi:excisionase family DNA binding protein
MSHTKTSKECFLKTSEVADLLGLTAATAIEMARRGRLPGLVRLGPRTFRWREAAILAHLAQAERAEP